MDKLVSIENCVRTSVPAPTPPVTANPVNGAVVYADWNSFQGTRAMWVAYNEEVCYNRMNQEFEKQMDALEKRMDARFAALGLGPLPAVKAQVGVVTDVALRPSCDAIERAQVATNDRAETGKWWYLTLTQKSAGPFSADQMRLWHHEGFLTSGSKIKASETGVFWPMASFRCFNPQCAMTEPAKVSRHVSTVCRAPAATPVYASGRSLLRRSRLHAASG